MLVIAARITGKKLLVENGLGHTSKLRHEINIVGSCERRNLIRNINFPSRDKIGLLEDKIGYLVVENFKNFFRLFVHG